jgi:hypothetical protein
MLSVFHLEQLEMVSNPRGAPGASLLCRFPSLQMRLWPTLPTSFNQAKLLKSYKRLTLAVESFDDSTLPPSVETISHEEDMIQLRRWSESSRTKWGLTRRVVVSRAEHHQQFYAGGDWGHCLFVETL